MPLTVPEFAAAVLQACHSAGVEEFCVCAGSRNSPLVRQIAAQGCTAWHFFEERDAAFFALGRTRATGRPCAVLTTSGTATVELFPAVVEAFYQGLPLLTLTADRPLPFRHSGAPQAIDQENLFGNYAEIFQDLSSSTDPEEIRESLAKWSRHRPAQLNICLEEPPAEGTYNPVPMPQLQQWPQAVMGNAESLKTFLSVAQNSILLIGDLLPPEQDQVRRFLSKASVSLIWAESASGLRSWIAAQSHLKLIIGGDSSLRHWRGDAVLRLGGVPSCRFWRDLENRPEIKVFSLSRSGHTGLGRGCETGPLVWLDQMPALARIALPEGFADRDQRMATEEILDRFPHCEAALIRALAAAVSPQDAIFLGNSMAIRTWNLVVPKKVSPKICQVMRGANGIDGNFSFALGAMADEAQSWMIVGDLTALYNLAAPWILEQLPAANRRFVIVNNGGGHIFRRLPSLRGISERERELIENPHAIDLCHWAALWKMPYRRVVEAAELADLPNGPVVIEIRPDADASEQFWLEMAALEASVWA